MKSLMHILLLTLTVLSQAVFAGESRVGQAFDYLCDDGIIDGGFEFRIEDLSKAEQHVLLLKKNKAQLEFVYVDTLALEKEIEHFRTYSNRIPDSKLEMSLSKPDANGNRLGVMTYTTKISKIRIPGTGSIICQRLLN